MTAKTCVQIVAIGTICMHAFRASGMIEEPAGNRTPKAIRRQKAFRNTGEAGRMRAVNDPDVLRDRGKASKRNGQSKRCRSLILRWEGNKGLFDGDIKSKERNGRKEGEKGCGMVYRGRAYFA